MIKAGILGADTGDAGELLRLLVRHPEVDSITAVSLQHRGLPLSSVHHGLIGDTEERFAPSLNASELDVVFICRGGEEADALTGAEASDELKLVDLTPDHALDHEEHSMVYGLSEIYRKRMVRGATRAAVPTAAAATALVALFPPAANLLLSGDVRIGASLFCPADAEVVKAQLQLIQSGFTGDVTFEKLPDEGERGLRVAVELPCSISLEHIEQMYDRIYDDHNFSYFLTRRLETKEAEGTHKTLISLTKPEAGTLLIEAVSDRHLRGGAGDALHAMNLLFGLHEKTGLDLKPSKY